MATHDAANERVEKEPAGRYVSAAVGALAAFLIGWIPLIGPILSGIPAGYLRGKNTKEGALTGGLGNFIAAFPLMAFFLFVFGLGTIVGIAEGDVDGVIGLLFLGLLVLLSVAYFIAFGALGGLIGSGISDRGDPTN